MEWKAPSETHTVWQNQWNDYIEAIPNDKRFNQAKRAAHSNLAAIMGRAAMHMGKEITWDEAINSNFQWFSDMDKLTHDSIPPVKADEDGQYPVPVPGEWIEI